MAKKSEKPGKQPEKPGKQPGKKVSKVRPEPTVAECVEEAEKVKGAPELKDLIVQEVRDMASGKQHSVQAALAYVRQLDSLKK